MTAHEFDHLIDGDNIFIETCKDVSDAYHAYKYARRALVLISLIVGSIVVALYINNASAKDFVSTLSVFVISFFSSLFFIKFSDMGGYGSIIDKNKNIISRLKQEYLFIEINVPLVYERKLTPLRNFVFRRRSTTPDVSATIISMSELAGEMYATVKFLNIKFCPSVNLRELLSYTLKRSETLNPGGAKRSATTALITGSAGRQNTVDTPNIPYTPWIVRRNIDWEAIGARRYELGLVGEHIVLHEETRSLTSDNRPDLAALVKNVDREGCLHPGYDIVSFTKAGQEKFIEVKATSGALGNPFEMSANELAFLESHPDSAYVYRVTIPDNSDQAQIAILNASVVLAGRREVTEYRVDPKSSE